MASAPPSESLVVDLPPDVDDGEFGEATTKRKLADSDWCSHGPTGKKRRKKAIWHGSDMEPFADQILDGKKIYEGRPHSKPWGYPLPLPVAQSSWPQYRGGTCAIIMRHFGSTSLTWRGWVHALEHLQVHLNRSRELDAAVLFVPANGTGIVLLWFGLVCCDLVLCAWLNCAGRPSKGKYK